MSYSDICKVNTFPKSFSEAHNSSSEDFIEKYYIKANVHFNELGHKLLFNEIKSHFKLGKILK
jgi:hypothetical protein